MNDASITHEMIKESARKAWKTVPLQDVFKRYENADPLQTIFYMGVIAGLKMLLPGEDTSECLVAIFHELATGEDLADKE